MTGPSLLPAPIAVVRQDLASRVIAPAFDLTTPEERARIIETEPLSYLAVTRSPEDHPAGEAPGVETTVRANREALARIDRAGAFEPEPAPTMLLYRLADGRIHQTGVVCEIDLADHRSGLVKPHEGVRPDRVALLERHLATVRASSSPVALTFKDDPPAGDLLDRLSARDPDLHHTGSDGVIQQVWRLDPDDVTQVQTVLAPASLYVVDGHHRLAAAAALARHSTEPDFGRALVVVFPPSRLRLFAFHRHVRDVTPDEIGRLERLSEMIPTGTDRPPLIRGSFGLYRDGTWARISPVQRHAGIEPVDRLDVISLHRDLLGPVFGIGLDSTDPRLSTVAGPGGRRQLEALVDAEGGLGFGLAPVTLEDLFAVADAGATLPAKSSFVWPKPRSGVFLRRR